MKQVFWIAVTLIQLVALLGLLAVTPALYRREERKAREQK